MPLLQLWWQENIWLLQNFVWRYPCFSWCYYLSALRKRPFKISGFLYLRFMCLNLQFNFRWENLCKYMKKYYYNQCAHTLPWPFLYDHSWLTNPIVTRNMSPKMGILLFLPFCTGYDKNAYLLQNLSCENVKWHL